MPASFESEFGSIRYTVKVIIDMPRRMNIEMEETIKVYKMIDANDPQLQVYWRMWNNIEIAKKIIFILLEKSVCMRQI